MQLHRKRFLTCRLHMRFCFPHKERCWVCPDFWREEWRVWTCRSAPVIDASPVR